MNKAELIKELANKTNLSQSQCAQVIGAYFEVVENELSEGRSVQVVGFGTFAVSDTKEREGRNPSTGQSMTIKAGRRVRFSAGKQLKDAINNKNSKKDVNNGKSAKNAKGINNVKKEVPKKK